MRRSLPALALVALLAGCASETAQESPAAVRSRPMLYACPEGATPPPAPPVPRTVTQLVDWTSAVYAALLRTERARAECARRLTRLNQWIDDELRGGRDGSG